MARGILKKQITEKSACAHFLKHVFQTVDTLWPQVLERLEQTGSQLETRPHDDDAAVEMAWAVIAANLTHLPALLSENQVRRIVKYVTDLLAEIGDQGRNPSFLVNNYIKAAHEASARSFPPVVGIAALLYQRAHLGEQTAPEASDVYTQNPDALTYLSNLILKLTWWDRFLTEYTLLPPRDDPAP
jgi:hypothetical protein